mmetsp:Transcript_28725/g.77790  ORF Transcript_28725/g.77790 Transcript_28725/m.77790 type:complete len:473 (-) Transcript_28725:625-2043(-)|eukprot:CAMPEP_0172368186 /NCGR_PEP_ID=MMETSP1060-20121228/25665_1 /TAXON_ID=37318 /ORGANISM="Pseudo-nitzschia pungens, Strain cf. cingulata" /LENGTH=472 /DNA_ID=CAMNT_0013092689 /DNA_START=287 /DNA_END=1705 /DNA_ORIENTATION=-
MVPVVSSNEATKMIPGLLNADSEIRDQNKRNERDIQQIAISSVTVPFPWKLHRILDDADAKGFDDIISWVPSDNGFKVYKPKVFDTDIMPKYFNHTKYKSFQRQLNMWGFDRVGSGPYKGAYLHRYFIRGKPELCDSMQRTKIKGIHSKKLRKNNASVNIQDGSLHTNIHSSVMSTSSSSLDAHASFKAAAQKVADLERKREIIQRKLEIVASRANAAAGALSNLSETKSCLSLQSDQKGQFSMNNDNFYPLSMSEGDCLLFGERNFFFVDDNKVSDKSFENRQHGQSPRRRAVRRYSLEPKDPNSDEYILRELDMERGGEGDYGQDFKYALDNGASLDDSILSPTPLPPNIDIVTATTRLPNMNASSLVIGLDRPKRRFSFLSTPVQNPLDKTYQIPPRPSSFAEEQRKCYVYDSSKLSSSNMNNNLMAMTTTNNMMMMNGNDLNSFNHKLSSSNVQDVVAPNKITSRISF